MKIINEKLLKEFRRARTCSWCNKPTPNGCDPNHVPAKGLGGGSQLDTRITLIANCRLCHQEYHAGVTTVFDMQAIIATREGVGQNSMREVIGWLLRLDKDASPFQIEDALKELGGSSQLLARKTLKEAGKL